MLDKNAAADKTAAVSFVMKVGLPPSTFRRCAADHTGEHKVKDFSGLANLRQ